MRSRHTPLLLLAVCFLEALASAQTPTKEETTTYTYNPDGALTRVVEQVTEDGLVGTPTVTYFAWDNCTPQVGNPGSPPTCALHPANGNLIGYGPSPGDESEWSAHYDVLDRLTQVTNAQGQTAVYQYHPDELLKASLNGAAPDTDGLQHYYDQSKYPQVTNLYDRYEGTLSSRHQRIRYLPDGSQQLLVRHRKDTDGVYNPVGQTMNAYRYDPYGAGGEVSAPMASMGDTGPLYSLDENPFQYSYELRDPVSGADYLRARWYLPGHQTFLQRDPVRNLNRYGYAFGNPILNHDPSGGRPERFGKWFQRLNPFEQGVLGALTFGTAPIAAASELEGKSFWTGDGKAWIAVFSYSQLVVSVAAVASFAGGVVSSIRLATRFSDATESRVLRRLVALGAVPGLAQSGLQVARDPRKPGSVIENLLGGAVAGFSLEVSGGLAGRAVGDEIFERRVQAVPQERVNETITALQDDAPALRERGGQDELFARAQARFGRHGFNLVGEDGVKVNGQIVNLDDHPPTSELTDEAIESLRTRLADLKGRGRGNKLSLVEQVQNALDDRPELSPALEERVIGYARELQRNRAQVLLDAMRKLEQERPAQ